MKTAQALSMQLPTLPHYKQIASLPYNSPKEPSSHGKGTVSRKVTSLMPSSRFCPKPIPKEKDDPDAKPPMKLKLDAQSTIQLRASTADEASKQVSCQSVCNWNCTDARLPRICNVGGVGGSRLLPRKMLNAETKMHYQVAAIFDGRGKRGMTGA